jgi:hypothetical protein
MECGRLKVEGGRLKQEEGSRGESTQPQIHSIPIAIPKVKKNPVESYGREENVRTCTRPRSSP